MAALQVTCQLNLVNGNKCRVGLLRHGFHRADLIARARRTDLFLTGHQRDFIAADFQTNALIDFACQQSKRQSDDTALMGHHAFNRIMRLARIGRPKNRNDIAAAEYHGLILPGRGLGHDWGNIFTLERGAY